MGLLGDRDLGRNHGQRSNSRQTKPHWPSPVLDLPVLLQHVVFRSVDKSSNQEQRPVFIVLTGMNPGGAIGKWMTLRPQRIRVVGLLGRLAA